MWLVSGMANSRCSFLCEGVNYLYVFPYLSFFLYLKSAYFCSALFFRQHQQCGHHRVDSSLPHLAIPEEELHSISPTPKVAWLGSFDHLMLSGEVPLGSPVGLHKWERASSPKEGSWQGKISALLLFSTLSHITLAQAIDPVKAPSFPSR